MTQQKIKEIFNKEGLRVAKDALEFIEDDLIKILKRYAENAKKNNIKTITNSNSEYWKFSFYELTGMIKKKEL